MTRRPCWAWAAHRVGWVGTRKKSGIFVYLRECPRPTLLGLGGSSGRVGWDPPYQGPKEGGDLVDDYRRSLVEVASS